jgi:hypothetical protein
MRISITLPGFSCMAAVARLAVRALLPGNPRADDAELIVSELAINAIRHSTSRGGYFELTLDLAPSRVRIEVKDGGPFGYPPPPTRPTAPGPSPLTLAPGLAPNPPSLSPPSPPHLIHPWTTMRDEDRDRDRTAEAEEYGLGLAIVTSASDKWGHSRYPDHEVWWAELAWPEASAVPTSTHVPAPHPAGRPPIESAP